jgi:effector-binding domain-containing protein
VSDPITLVELSPRRIATIRRTLPQAKLGPFMGEVLGTIAGQLGAQGARPVGPPLARYYNGDPAAFDTEAGLPFEGTFSPTGEVRLMDLPGGKAARTLHRGSYETLSAEYRRLEGWLTAQGLRPGRGPREVYLSEPGTPAADLLTEVVWPVET